MAGASLTTSGGVGVDSFELCVEAILVVFVGVGLETTVTTVVAVLDVGAVNELLFRERKQGAGGNEVSTFEGTSRGESPA